MKETVEILALMAMSLTSCLILTFGTGTQESTKNTAVAGAATPPGPSDFQAQRKEAEQQARPEVEKERKEAEEEAKRTLDKEAIAAIEQTQKAISAIAAGKTAEALALIEQATGKINILLARNPATALIPVDLEVAVIDTAPRDI